MFQNCLICFLNCLRNTTRDTSGADPGPIPTGSQNDPRQLPERTRKQFPCGTPTPHSNLECFLSAVTTVMESHAFSTWLFLTGSICCFCCLTASVNWRRLILGFASAPSASSAVRFLRAWRLVLGDPFHVTVYVEGFVSGCLCVIYI